MAKCILLHDYIKYSLVKSIRDFVNTSIITDILKEEDKTVFGKAAQGSDAYTPVAVLARQIVSGTNAAYLCLKNAEDGAVFASGVAALAAVFTTFLNSGDHAIVFVLTNISEGNSTFSSWKAVKRFRVAVSLVSKK